MSRGPHGFDVAEIMEATLAVARSAQDFEDEHEAWDMAPPSSRPALVDVQAAFDALQSDLHKLRALLNKSGDAYTGSMQRITQQASGGPASGPTRISQRRRT